MRKRKVKPGKQFYWERFSEENDPNNGNYLSPLAKAAFNNRLQTFDYKISGELLRFDSTNARAIYSATSEYIKTLKPVIQDAKIKMLRRNPAIRKFLNSSIESHNLPTRLLHLLKDLEAERILDVAENWHTRLYFKRGIGNSSLQILITLFDKNGCFTLTL